MHLRAIYTLLSFNPQNNTFCFVYRVMCEADCRYCQAKVLVSFDRNIFRHQNYHLNEQKYFPCIFFRITEAQVYPLVRFVLKSGSLFNSVFKTSLCRSSVTFPHCCCCCRETLTTRDRPLVFALRGVFRRHGTDGRQTVAYPSFARRSQRHNTARIMRTIMVRVCFNTTRQRYICTVVDHNILDYSENK